MFILKKCQQKIYNKQDQKVFDGKDNVFIQTKTAKLISYKEAWQTKNW